MKKYLTAACAMFLATAVYAEDLNDQYPKTREERQADEMGSVLGGEGVVVRPGGANVEGGIVAAEGNYNKYLWQAAQEMADVAPLSLVDAKHGVLSTDWYSSKNAANTSSKLTVRIIGSKLAPEALEVKLQQRTMKEGRWVEEDSKSKAASDIFAKIIKRAKELSSK